jgi:dTDP-4-amino-4,6-dideoxygalactose transaminase
MVLTMSDRWKIPFNRPYACGKEIEYITEAVRTGHLSGNGKYTRLCQEWLEKTLGCHQALLTHSGTGALELAALLCEIERGDEVIMPSFTFVTTATAFALRGAVPVFIDIQPNDLNLDPERLASAITPRTKAVVPVHYAGKPCNMRKITEIAEQSGIDIIEDAAHSLLSKTEGRYLGTWGRLACLSFHESKNIISGEGGALLINDPELMKRARILWHKGTDRFDFDEGRTDKYKWVDVGSSFCPSELVGAFLLAQMEQAHGIIERRVRLSRAYRRRLTKLEEDGLLRLGGGEEGDHENGHIFYVHHKNTSR